MLLAIVPLHTQTKPTKAKPTGQAKITAQQGPVKHAFVRADRQLASPPQPSLSKRQKKIQPLLAERCNSDKRKRMGEKFPNPQKLKVGKVVCAGANPLSAIKLLDLLKLS